MKLNNLILKAINEGIAKSLLQFDDDDDISFKKSNNSIQPNQQRIKNQLYDFVNCIYGDKVYYDKDLGYNLISGEYYGFCCIEKGQLDEQPRFVYKEDIGKMSWGNAIEKCQEMPNGYLPNIDELKLAYDNGLKNDLSTDDHYWSSTQYDSDDAYIILTNFDYVYYYDKDSGHLVRPFFHIPQIKNKVNESINLDKSLLQFDDEIEFNKSNVNKVAKQKTKDDIIEYSDFVDLGLPSGTLWAKHNLGATCEDTPSSWYGNYYAFGEGEPKETYDETTYKCKWKIDQWPDESNPVKRTLEHSAANIPSKYQANELIENTSYQWIDNYENIQGLNGMLFTGSNGNSIFIPAGGDNFGIGISHDHKQCYYWTDRLDKKGNRFGSVLWSREWMADIFHEDRLHGALIRPVVR